MPFLLCSATLFLAYTTTKHNLCIALNDISVILNLPPHDITTWDGLSLLYAIFSILKRLVGWKNATFYDFLWKCLVNNAFADTVLFHFCPAYF